MPNVVPVKKTINGALFVFVTGVFWGQCFVRGGFIMENAKSSHKSDDGDDNKNPLPNFHGRAITLVVFLPIAKPSFS